MNKINRAKRARVMVPLNNFPQFRKCPGIDKEYLFENPETTLAADTSTSVHKCVPV